MGRQAQHVLRGTWGKGATGAIGWFRWMGHTIRLKRHGEEQLMRIQFSSDLALGDSPGGLRREPKRGSLGRDAPPVPADQITDRGELAIVHRHMTSHMLTLC